MVKYAKSKSKSRSRAKTSRRPRYNRSRKPAYRSLNPMNVRAPYFSLSPEEKVQYLKSQNTIIINSQLTPDMYL